MAEIVTLRDATETAARPRARHVVHDIARRAPVRARPPVLRIEPTAPVEPITPAERTMITTAIAAMRATFQAEDGDIEVVDISGGTVQVRLTGACVDCGAAPLSLAGVQHRLTTALGRRIRVRPAAEPLPKTAEEPVSALDGGGL